MKVVRVRGQAGFREGGSIVDHILTLCTLIRQEIFAGRCLYSCLVDFKKAFDIVPCDKLWERLQKLDMPINVQKVVKILYTIIYTRVQTNGDTHGEVMLDIGVEQGCLITPTPIGMYIDKFEKIFGQY